ncbi:amidohydrolase [Sporosarcina sp. ZBG7A]|uniref:amidohydrolase n=1 Tax=Sporosarcina sp. ZBG7A TaxID=1582223 RepID=UPI00057A10CC|nr:amidohydrolase [Sporosarcina sp. ZBG7A]
MPDLIITNAVILKLNANNEQARSLAVKNGRITDIWDTPTPPAGTIAISDRTKIMDLEGATLIPGFIDTHNHILSYALLRDMVDCSSPLNQSIDDLLNQISSKAEQLPDGQWIQGFGYDDTLLSEQRHPTRKELDQAAPNHPVYINHSSGHIAVANSLALSLAQVPEDIEDSSKGHFGRDLDGRLNGVLYEHAATSSVSQAIPEKKEEDLIELLGQAAEEYIAQGITMNTVAAIGMSNNPRKELDVHLKAGKTNVNPMRTQLLIIHSLLQDDGMFSHYSAKELDEEIQEKSNGRVSLDGVKLFQDGSIQGLTAALREPYFCDESLTGTLIHEQTSLNEQLLNFHQRGFRIAIHGNGDKAIESILKGYEYALQNTPQRDHRHRIEHAQTATIEDLNKMKELGVASSFFINHVYYFGDRHERLFLGPERAKNMNPLKTASEKGIRFTVHSDCPITPISPLFSIWASVNRLTKEGHVLGEDEKCDVITALKSMTIYGAELNFDEESSGSIEVGKRADFAVLDADPTSIDPLYIKDINVLATVIDGELVYERV